MMLCVRFNKCHIKYIIIAQNIKQYFYIQYTEFQKSITKLQYIISGMKSLKASCIGQPITIGKCSTEYSVLWIRLTWFE